MEYEAQFSVLYTRASPRRRPVRGFTRWSAFGRQTITKHLLLGRLRDIVGHVGPHDRSQTAFLTRKHTLQHRALVHELKVLWRTTQILAGACRDRSMISAGSQWTDKQINKQTRTDLDARLSGGADKHHQRLWTRQRKRRRDKARFASVDQ